jgi:DNA processing protein
VIGVGDRGPVGTDRPMPPRLDDLERERQALAVLISVQGLGPITLARLLRASGSATGILAMASGAGGVRQLIDAGASREDPGRSMPTGVATSIVEAAAASARITDRLRALDVRVVLDTDSDYPARLRLIELPPAVLFVRGAAGALNARHAVAVVGTRRPTDAGRRAASRIAGALVRAEAVVVSGLAIGIDGAAHAAAVEAGGRTVAFIGGGHGRLAPLVHDRLADAIVAGGGAVISEYAPDTDPTKGTFPRRNRLISGAADAVVVVEAGAKSGALLTASWALEQGRECFLVPGAIDAPMSAGCNGFLRDWPGAARIVSGVPQLLDDLGLPGMAALPPTAAPRLAAPGRPSSEVRPASPGATVRTVQPRDEPIAVAIARGAETVDEIVATTGQTIAAVLGAVTRLETAGLVRNHHGRYVAAGSLESPATPANAERPRSGSLPISRRAVPRT